MTRKLPKKNQSHKRERKQKLGLFDHFFKLLAVSFAGLFLLVIMLIVIELLVYNRFVEGLQAQNIVIASADAEDSQSVLIALHVSPNEELEFVTLAPTIPVEIIGGYGEYQLRSVLPLLKVDKKSNQAIQATFSFALNTGINQVWQDNNLDKDFTQFDVQQLGWRLIRGQIKTGLSPWQRFHWGVYLSRFSETDIAISSASSLEEWQESKQWWSLGKLLYLCSVAVVNTTDTAGLGGQVSGVLESAGLNVIRVANDQTPREATTVVIDFDKDHPNETCDQVLNLITAYIPNATNTEYNPDATLEHRANISIILGEDNASL